MRFLIIVQLKHNVSSSTSTSTTLGTKMGGEGYLDLCRFSITIDYFLKTQLLSPALDGTLSVKIHKYLAVNCEKLIKLPGTNYEYFFTFVSCAQMKAEFGFMLIISFWIEKSQNKLTSSLVIVGKRKSNPPSQAKVCGQICTFVQEATIGEEGWRWVKGEAQTHWLRAPFCPCVRHSVHACATLSMRAPLCPCVPQSHLF